MDTTPSGWTVIDREAGVLTRDYEFSKGARSTTFVARMANGQLMVMSPSTRLSDAAAKELGEFGEVGALVANNGFHHLGQAEWRGRFPEARSFASPEAAARIAKKSKVELAFEPVSELAAITGDDVGFRDVPNTKCGESWCWAKTSNGYAWYTSDVLANMPSLPSSLPLKLMFKWTKSAPGYRVFHLALKFIVKDKKATLKLLREDTTERPPTIIVPGHGGLLTHEGLAAETEALINAAL